MPVSVRRPDDGLKPTPTKRRGWGGRLSHARSLLLFLPLYSLATAGFGAVSLLFSLFDRSGRWQHRTARAWARTLLWMARIRVTVVGRENLPRGQPCLLVCNHLSYMDIPVVFAHVPEQFRIVARADLFGFPFLGWHLRRSGHLPVDRDSAQGSLRSLLRAANDVRDGLPVFVFPEGGRSMSGVLQDFLPGAFFLALRARVPVVPLALVGTREVLPPNSFHLRPRRVKLVILPPVATANRGAREVEALAGEVRERIARRLAEEKGGDRG